MTYKFSLFKKCAFEIQKLFKNIKRLILKYEKYPTFKCKKKVLFLNTKNVFCQLRKMCCF